MIYASRMNFGKMSLLPMPESRKTNTINAIAHFPRFQGAAVYHIQTPNKAITYPLASLPVLKRMTNKSTEASMVSRKARFYTVRNVGKEGQRVPFQG